MTAYEIYSFIVTAIVLAALTAVFICFLRMLLKFYFKMVRHGLEDEAIIAEQDQAKGKSAWDIVNDVASIIVCTALTIVFLFSLFAQITENKYPFGLPSLTVVKSSSMSYKDSGNTYLEANGLDDQFDTFDIIIVNELPDEFDLQLYDVVVYEAQDGTTIVHRIIAIEEPNESHPDCRYFTFRGDAVQQSDRYPVLYSQMKGVYSGERIRFFGSFIMFMQSPAGWICILLVLTAMIATPILEKKIAREKAERLAIINGQEEQS